MIASCCRRSGNYQLAFDTYKRIHERFPENLECNDIILARAHLQVCASLYASRPIWVCRLQQNMQQNFREQNQSNLIRHLILLPNLKRSRILERLSGRPSLCHWQTKIGMKMSQHYFPNKSSKVFISLAFRWPF